MLPQSLPNGSFSAVSRLMACLIACVGINSAVIAAPPASIASLAQEETNRRISMVNRTNTEIEHGYQLIQEGKAEEALGIFSAAYESLPRVPLTQESVLAARNGYVVAGCMHAENLMAQGRHVEANALLDKILSPEVAPRDSRALGFKQKFADPDRYPPALTAKHIENVESVQMLLIKANSFVEIGDPDKAIATYQDVLRKDPTNSAARRGMERAENERQKYFKSAYDHQRAKMLGLVDKSWEDPLPLSSQDVSSMFGASAKSQAYSQSGREVITEKLRSIKFPIVEFSGATLDEVVELLRVRSRDLDPSGAGINFVLNVPPEARNKAISLNLFNVPMEEVLRYVSEMCGVSYRVDDHVVNFVSLSERDGTLITRSFRVPPDFIQNGPVGDPAASAPADPFANQAPAGGGLIIRRMGAKEFLESRGVSFPEGSSASYSNATSTLVVRNTISNIETVELLVEQATKSSPKQAVITVRMLEVNQTNLDELGFDWLLAGVGVNANNVFFGGGNAGNGNAYSSANYPFQSSVTTPAITDGAAPPNVLLPAQPVNAALGGPLPLGVARNPPYGGGPITSGLRSGTYAVANDGIDNLLQAGSVTASQSVAPGILSVAGVFTDPQFQSVLRGLAQKKGVDINATPSVTTKNGLKATVEITREFIYPTEFDPPQLPQVSRNSSAPLIATPTTPTAFETRKTGVELEVEPIISEDGRTVELTIMPSLTSFEGFVNYGSPIQSPASSALQTLVVNGSQLLVPFYQPDRLITPNLILQPIFKTQKVTTAVKIWDGATVVLGGAKIQKRSMVNDALPMLGNLPIVGRFFQSNTTKTETKNIIIFVTVDVIDPSGQKINKDTAAVSQ